MKQFDEEIEALRIKRLAFLGRIWEMLTDNNILSPKRFSLSSPLLNEVALHYLADVKVLKSRYKIDKKIQLHKIAGLTTGSILRFRPIIPTVDEFNSSQEIYANEIFAITHGLAICGEFSVKECEVMIQEAWFDTWFNDFLYLLHNRNYTSESLMFIYQTLSIFKFSSNFEIETL